MIIKYRQDANFEGFGLDAHKKKLEITLNVFIIHTNQVISNIKYTINSNVHTRAINLKVCSIQKNLISIHTTIKKKLK